MPVEAKEARLFRALEPALETLDTQLRCWQVATSPVAPALAEAYEQSGLFSEHTFGPWGSKGGPWESDTAHRYLYGEPWKVARARGAYRKYEAAFDDKRAFAHKADEIVRRELSQRLDLLAKSVKASGRRVVVYNALPWERSGAVEIPGEPGRWLFAERVPANGYRTYSADSIKQTTGPASSATNSLETPFFRVEFDLKRGGISSLVEKRTRRELVDKTSPYALGQFLHERFDHQQMLAFHNAYGRPGYTWFKGNLPEGAARAALTPPAWSLAVRRTATADVATLTAIDTLGLAKKLCLVFSFSRQQPYADVDWRVTDKTPDPMPEGGWLCFPFAIAQPQFLLGRLGGPIDPAKDIAEGANRHYFCLNSGLTIRGGDGTGVGLCPLDTPCVSLGEPGLWKFSLDYVPRRPSAFVNLYNNEWNTNFPEWQEGSWSSRVRLWPVTRVAKAETELAIQSWEARLPLLAAVADGSGGTLPRTRAGLNLSRPGVLVTAFGRNPDGEGTLLRVWDQSGESGKLVVDLPAGYKLAVPVNLRGERTGKSIDVKDGRLSLELHAYAPVSFILN